MRGFGEAFGSTQIGSAVLSECGRYRYRLEREADPLGSGAVNFVMLNPSTADATADDPTIRRCVGFAKSRGYARLVVTNLFAFRATNPADMRGRTLAELVGPDNDEYLISVARAADAVVCAWGANGNLYRRKETVKRMLSEIPVNLTALKMTKHGDPQHPLYIAGKTMPVAFG